MVTLPYGLVGLDGRRAPGRLPPLLGGVRVSVSAEKVMNALRS